MDLGLPGDDDPRRAEVRDWLDGPPAPDADASWPRPATWRRTGPPPFGLDADPLTQLMIDEELRRTGVRRPINPIGIGWAGPTLMYAGTDGAEGALALAAAQRRGVLVPAVQRARRRLGPGGADAPGPSVTATTRSSTGRRCGPATRTSPSGGSCSPAPIRRPPSTRGISYFVCPMDAPGIDIRPLIDMTGEHAFNEVFLTDVRIPADHLIGPEHGGWELAKVTLGNERVSLSGEGALWGMGPTAEDLVDLIRGAGGCADPVRCGTGWSTSGSRPRSCGSCACAWSRPSWRGGLPGAEASVRKAIADAHGQHIMDVARDLAGPYAMLAGTGPVGGWASGLARGRSACGGRPAMARDVGRPTPPGPVASCSRRR